MNYRIQYHEGFYNGDEIWHLTSYRDIELPGYPLDQVMDIVRELERQHAKYIRVHQRPPTPEWEQIYP